MHDQLTFALLKKTFMDERNKSFGSFLLPRDCLRSLLMRCYYDAEKVAFDKDIVIQSFRDTGLWPFRPEKIEENCRKFCAVRPMPDENDDLSNLARAINETIKKEIDSAVEKIRSLDCVRMTSPKKGAAGKRLKKKTRKSRATCVLEKSTPAVTVPS